jgi:ATP-binding cassette subfamily B protein
MDWKNLRRMLPYILDYRARVVVALSFLLIAKLATVGVPLVLKEIVDTLEGADGKALALPAVLLLAYGALRGAQSVFNELRDVLFARVRYSAMHRLSLRVLEHLHRLSLRYHLERRTGAIARDLERGAQSISSILNYLVFNIVPTIAEFALVAVILLGRYPARFALVTFVSVAVYVAFTLSVTNWRMHYRHRMNALDSEANGRAVDSLLNYETVKYFTNETFELRRYDATLGEWEDQAVRSTTTMSLLNLGQGMIIAAGVTMVMFFAAQAVVAGTMTLGDLVLVNTMMLQLFMPLNFLGVVYRAMNYAFADMDQILHLLDRREDIRDRPGAGSLTVAGGEVRFESVNFSYQPERQVLKDVDFTIPAGNKLAIVGPSGAGKSTLARLMFRFYDIDSGRILVDGVNIRDCTQESLRRAIGIVPQDTVLFNETIYYNIRYARPEAAREDVEQAARMADIHEFIASLPQGYDTVVGERGLKLSGGEKQRVAIARVILKRPGILVFDVATSSLDSRSEQAILSSLGQVSRQTTTMVIAHRLSTVIDADRILVMDGGVVTERGTHAELLEADGLYAHLWTLQQEERMLEGEARSLGVGP